MSRIKIEKELLESLYLGNGYTAKEIGKIFCVSKGTILLRLKEHKIPTKVYRKYIIEKELVIALYYGNGYNLKEIADIFGCTSVTIRDKLIEYNVPRRSISEISKGKNNHFYGYHHTKEAKKHIGDAHRGKNNYMYGRIFTTEEREKMSKDRKKCKIEKELLEALYFGNNYTIEKIAELTGFCPATIFNKMNEYGIERKYVFWNNILTPYTSYPLEFNNSLRKRIRDRDNHTCKECNITEDELGYKLSVHHIDYNKQNSKSENLISLCRSCHSKTGFNRKDWEKYYKNLVK